MTLKTLLLSAATLATISPAFAATECAQHIQAIERRMHSTGASEVTGQAASPASKSQASNAAHQAAAPTNPNQAATPEKMKTAESLLAKAKQQDQAGDKQGCEATMEQVQANMGAIP